MLKPLRSGIPAHAPGGVDKLATGIATPEQAADYFRRLRLYHITIVVSGLVILGASVGAVFLHGASWRIGAFVSGLLISIAVRALSQFFFRCPACDYIFKTGRWHTEPKWHACPSCGIQFTPERKLRWPAL